MLSVGDMAPDFTAQDQNGNTVTLSEHRGQTVALYFYPKDDTPGCTKQACSLRDGHKELQDAGITVIGVSVDDTASHEAFAEKYDLPFTLVADPDKEIVTAYGVKGRLGTAKRVTFLIDTDGTIKQVLTDITVSDHAEQILEAR